MILSGGNLGSLNALAIAFSTISSYRLLCAIKEPMHPRRLPSFVFIVTNTAASSLKTGGNCSNLPRGDLNSSLSIAFLASLKAVNCSFWVIALPYKT